jgi:hypothetical protein
MKRLASSSKVMNYRSDLQTTNERQSLPRQSINLSDINSKAGDQAGGSNCDYLSIADLSQS